MQIDHQQLSPEALQGLLEAFVQREGTDYGQEVEQHQKVAQVRDQLYAGSAFVVFDGQTQEFNIVSKDELLQISVSSELV